MIKAVIFDMDGLLIDSEPHWRRAIIDVFAGLGVNLTEQQCAQTMGSRIDAIADYWLARFPHIPIDTLSVQRRLADQVIELISADPRPMPGALEALDLIAAHKLPLALASSSIQRIIDAALESLNIRHRFDVIYSAEFERLGKPDPAVFLTTAKKLGVSPRECLVLEDSHHGVRAGLAAGMKTIWVPSAFAQLEEGLSPHLTLKSLRELSPAVWS